MTARDDLHRALREILGPVARAHGYKGTPPTWRKLASSGTWAVINVQSSAFGTAEECRCIVNVAVAPDLWLRHLTADEPPRIVHEYHGLYRKRLDAPVPGSDRENWWSVTDPATAAAAVKQMVEQLEVFGWDTVDRLLTPAGMLAQFESDGRGFIAGIDGMLP